MKYFLLIFTSLLCITQSNDMLGSSSNDTSRNTSHETLSIQIGSHCDSLDIDSDWSWDVDDTMNVTMTNDEEKTTPVEKDAIKVIEHHLSAKDILFFDVPHKHSPSKKSALKKYQKIGNQVKIAKIACDLIRLDDERKKLRETVRLQNELKNSTENVNNNIIVQESTAIDSEKHILRLNQKKRTIQQSRDN